MLQNENIKIKDTEQFQHDHEQSKDSWLTTDEIMMILLIILAFLTRFFRLSQPSGVVFDEYHFGKFVNWIFQRSYYFDIHPPLGKLILALGGYLAGYKPVEGFMYDNIGKEYGDTLYYPLREVAAVFGVMTVPLTYKVARTMDMSVWGASVVAGAVLFDNLVILESRLILIDSQVLFFSVASLYCALELWKVPRSRKKQRWMWILVTAIVSGCALSIKHTCLATPAMIAVVSFFGLHFIPHPLYLEEMLVAGVVGIGMYVLFFYIHFLLLPNDGMGAAYMDFSFQKTLLGHSHYNPNAPKISFLRKFVDLNVRMVKGNAAIQGHHGWDSVWYQWIVNWRGVLYYQLMVDEKRQIVYLLGNPIVVWGALLGVIIFAVLIMYRIRYRYDWVRKDSGQTRVAGSTKTEIETAIGRWLYDGVFVLCGWLVNLLPFILVDRAAFLYHYIPGLFYGELMMGLLIDTLPNLVKKPVCIVVILCFAASFVYFSPWTYAIPLTNDEHMKRRWLRRWD